MLNRARYFLPLLLWCVSSSGQNTAQSPTASFRANTQDMKGSMMHLRGNVEIEADNFVVRANEADVNTTSGEIVARGAARAAKDKSYLEKEPAVESLRANYKTGTVTFVLPSGSQPNLKK